MLKWIAPIAGVILIYVVGIGLPLAMPESPGEVSAAQASRLKTQARLRLDLMPAWAKVSEAHALGSDPDSAEGIVRFVGPFGVPVAQVKLASSGSEDFHVWRTRLLFSWGLLVAGEAICAYLLIRALIGAE